MHSQQRNYACRKGWRAVRRVVIEMVDDLDQESGDDVATVHFALDGVDYEIDLNAVNAERLRGGLAPFVAAGRVVESAEPEATVDVRSWTIRQWARTNGFSPCSRGPIPSQVMEAFVRAGGRAERVPYNRFAPVEEAL